MPGRAGEGGSNFPTVLTKHPGEEKGSDIEKVKEEDFPTDLPNIVKVKEEDFATNPPIIQKVKEEEEEEEEEATALCDRPRHSVTGHGTLSSKAAELTCEAVCPECWGGQCACILGHEGPHVCQLCNYSDDFGKPTEWGFDS